jgi:hypothetical protein
MSLIFEKAVFSLYNTESSTFGGSMKTKFTGRHWETGSIHNALALQGIKAPHTDEPYSEALLLGVSGGIAFGYFTFEYKGHLPHVALLTRNTFDVLTLPAGLASSEESVVFAEIKYSFQSTLATLIVGKVALEAQAYQRPRLGQKVLK